MKCPEEAIVSALSRPFLGALLRPFFRYNVHRWVREGDLDYVRVVHRRGEIKNSDRISEDRHEAIFLFAVNDQEVKLG
jgi:hypothetical protein